MPFDSLDHIAEHVLFIAYIDGANLRKKALKSIQRRQVLVNSLRIK